MLYILHLAAGTLQKAINTVFQFLTGNYLSQPTQPSLESQTMKNVVILGASFAGINTAHRILKRPTKTGPVKVTLVAPNDHFYWNIALPRALVPGLLADEKIFQPIAAGFKQYPATRFEFVVASAKSIDARNKKVEVSGPAGERTLDYDYLVLATGSKTKDNTPFKIIGSTEETKDALHNLQAQVKNSKRIVVAGAGAVGVEIAGELAFEYGSKKDIFLIASGPTVLEAAIPSVSKTVLQQLQTLKVKTKLQTKVASSVQTSDGRQELIFSDGEKLIADLYIPAFGIIPNSEYVPAKYLDHNGYVIVDDFLKVKGAEDIWAIGDISDHEPSQFMFADRQGTYLAKNLILVLNGKPQVPYKLGTRGMGLLVGRKTGTGHLGNVKLPGFLVGSLRKNLFIENLPTTVNGSAFS